jgi:RNA polymerase sigma-70 factor (ECF subfamily)
VAIESDSELKTISQLLTSNDKQGIDQLMASHRIRLKNMIKSRLDPRLSARVDPSDVVQETFIEAARKLPEYI